MGNHMPRFIYTVCASVPVAVWLWSMPPSAFAQAATSTNAAFSADQTRVVFANAGYLVGESHTWGWMQPPFTAFRVSDPATGRVLTVVVYANVDAAEQARLQAARGQIHDASSVDGPPLVPGFGRSLWSGNVALVQSTESKLQHLYQQQEARDMRVDDDATPVVERALDSVDVDLAKALVIGAVGL
jgi:hypothetical protein